MKRFLSIACVCTYLFGSLPGPGTIIFCLGEDGHVGFEVVSETGCSGGSACTGDVEHEESHGPCADVVLHAVEQHLQSGAQTVTLPAPTELELHAFQVAPGFENDIDTSTVALRPHEHLQLLQSIILII
jgi:hypothetical protein